VSDPQLAANLNMKPGNYYCYYKPSFLNGFSETVGQDMDMSFLQAFEGVCRDEFQPIPEAIFSEDFQQELEEYNGLQT
jgi:hypothetical protein